MGWHVHGKEVFNGVTQVPVHRDKRGVPWDQVLAGSIHGWLGDWGAGWPLHAGGPGCRLIRC